MYYHKIQQKREAPLLSCDNDDVYRQQVTDDVYI